MPLVALPAAAALGATRAAGAVRIRREKTADAVRFLPARAGLSAPPRRALRRAASSAPPRASAPAPQASTSATPAPLSRRQLLSLGAALPAVAPLLLSLSRPLPAAAAPAQDWAAVRADILAVIADASVPGSGIGDKGPTLVRLRSFFIHPTFSKPLFGGEGRASLSPRSRLCGCALPRAPS
jgi:hypothetical protein